MTAMKTSSLLKSLACTACFGALIVPGSAFGLDFVWDGTTDTNWTNGPQDATAGYVPVGTTGSNWTIDGGAPGQIALPDATTPGSNMIDYLYSGHTWTISNTTVSEDVQIKLDGGSLDITNSTVSLLPTSATTGAGLSGLNLGQNGAPTVATFTDSTVNLSRSNFGGRAFGVTNGSSVSLVNTDLVLTAETGNALMDLSNPGTTVTMDANSSITATGSLEVRSPEALFTMEGGTLDIDHLRLNANGGPTTEDILFDFQGGTVTVSDPNGLRGNLFEGSFNWTGAAGSGTVTHTDLSTNDITLAGKTAQGFFSIDGTRINPVIAQATDWTDQTNIDAINAEMLALAVNNKYLEITLVEDLSTVTGFKQVISLLELSGLTADLSGDGDVDDEDLGLFFSAFTGPDNGPSLDPRADLSGDGDVDDEDLGQAFSQFTGPLGPASVPEPTSLALLGIGGLLAARRRRA